MQTEFVADFCPDGGARIELIERRPRTGLFGSPRTRVVPTVEWPGVTGNGSAIRLLDLAARGEAEDDGNAIRLPPDVVAKLDTALAGAIGLPPPAPIVLSLKGRGLIVDESFGVDWKWVRANGTPVHVAVTGARVRMDGREFRLPDPLFSLQRAAAKVNAEPDLPSKQAAYAELRRLLEQHGTLALIDGILDETRIAYAAHFSLAVSGSAEGLTFDPVLFAPRVGEAAAEGAVADEEADNLLTPAQQTAFARIFRKRRGRSSSYLLPDGLLLFMDPSIAEVLRIVGKKQSAPPEERRRFAIAPRRILAEELGREAEAFETLFIETAQYSARVTGIDPWRTPVLPWIKPRPNSWLPERLGIAIGDPPNQKILDFSADDPEQVAQAIEAASKEIEAALEAGKDEVVVQGNPVPATPAALDALRSLADVSRAAAEAEAAREHDPSPPARIKDKFFLCVRENFEELEYAPLIVPAPCEASVQGTPRQVRTALKPHQIEGFNWLVRAWKSLRPGVLLADDMGLGKTLQALTFFCWLRAEEKINQPILVVAPTGLLVNWQQEIGRHLEPDALGEVLRAYGADLAALRTGAGTDIKTGAPQLDVQPWRKAGIVLTTYETLRDYHMSFARVGWAVVALDEAQRVKNPAAQVTRAAKTLQARLSVALTGTPVENRLHDLWSISDIVHPGLLGTSKAFENAYGKADEACLRELNARLTAPERTWPPFMLRRMKSDHVEGLPRKTIVECARPMPQRQAQAYSNAVNRALLLRPTMERDSVLKTLAELRSISLAPSLPTIGDDFCRDSARLQATFEILEKIQAKGEKALIFCESLELQPLLGAEIRRRFHLRHPVSCISGEIPGETRQQLVNQFQARAAGFDVMILSPRAGGVGLTLTAANHVIHLSRWWNPAVEDQATDRVYRIGQDKDVTVWLPIAEHPTYGETSFDRKLDALMARKRALAAGLLIEPESPDDAQNLLDQLLVESPPASSDRTGDEGQGQADKSGTDAPQPETGATRPEQLTGLRYEKRANSPMRWEVFTDALAGCPVRKLEIVDPYAAGSREACRSLAQFLAGLRERGVQVQTVDLTCFDNSSLRENRFQSDVEQKKLLSESISHNRLEDQRFYPNFLKRERDLHDQIIWD